MHHPKFKWTISLPLFTKCIFQQNTLRKRNVVLGDNFCISLPDPSNVTLFSNSQGRYSVDTWFEIDLPFSIEPVKDCLNPEEHRVFKVTFAPLDAFDYRVKLKSTIGNDYNFLLLNRTYGRS